MYLVKLKPKAIKDLQSISKPEARKIAERMKNLEQGLVGDIKRLTNFTPEYRLRIGDYRILFEIEGQEIIIHRIKHRKEAYKKR
ncbi:MAG: type II toxin-antitoxin system RelE/ParE family toxin [Planctomycetes bacterium]|nr:type II toxin-antitoxin system RelE/ParE family toxin [Planctomycetota bacterium]MDE1890334.1 type II toxin-antitoxin system RelE/ParE family toxin [Planctomycetota bacterium]